MSPLADKKAPSSKAAFLLQAAAAGLPVPPISLLNEEQLIPPAPFSEPMAVRSAFSAEDGQEFSGAGLFESMLWVAPSEFAAAVLQVRASAERFPEPCRAQVLVMPMVSAQFAGVAFLQDDYLDDLIEFVPGVADALLSGKTRGRQLQLSRLGDTSTEFGFEERLGRMLGQVRSVFGPGKLGWDVEWADDGKTCWLLQLRPITRPLVRNDWLTYANIREILPDPPSVLMTDIVLSGSPRLYQYYRNFDSELPSSRPLIEDVYGRPVFNLSLLCETLRWWGLPSSLVTDNIGGKRVDSNDLQLRQMLRKTPVLLRQAWSQATALLALRRGSRRLEALGKTEFETLQQCSQAAVDLFVDLVTVMLNLTAALSAPLAILRKLGVLAEHSRRHRSISTAMYDDLEELHQLLSQHPHWRASLKQGQLPQEADFQSAWGAYLAKHGHRGIYESDLARPRFHEDPRPLLQALLAPTQVRPGPASFSLMGHCTRPLWWWCSAVLRARELWRYEAMRCYDHLRSSLLRLTPVGEKIFDLKLQEVASLDQGWRPDEAFWAQRKRQIEESQALALPHTFRRFSPLVGEPEGSSDTYQGTGLTRGKVRGKAWVLSSPSSQVPEDLLHENLVLIARTVDAGWIPTFRLVQAVAVELGGDLSHGSIILRELGFPALTGAEGLTRGLKTGDTVELDAERGYLRRL